MGYRYRCSSQKCRIRRTLKKRIEEYVKTPVCRACGSRLSIDSYRQSKKEVRKDNCYCDGLHFSIKGSPHRRGSKWCVHYKGEYTEEELRERHCV